MWLRKAQCVEGAAWFYSLKLQCFRMLVGTNAKVHLAAADLRGDGIKD